MTIEELAKELHEVCQKKALIKVDFEYLDKRYKKSYIVIATHVNKMITEARIEENEQYLIKPHEEWQLRFPIASKRVDGFAIDRIKQLRGGR